MVKGRRSFTVARIAGIAVQVHPALLLLALVDIVLSGRPAWLWGAAALSLLWHELGHAFTARAARLRVTAIELHLLGGRTEMIGTTSERNLAAVAAAGPLASAFLGGLLLLLWWALLARVAPAWLAEAVQAVGWMNLGWAALNLLPFYPLDGGHVLRYVLGVAVGPRDATVIILGSSAVAATIAMVLSAGVGFWPGVAVGAYVLLLGYREWVRQGLPGVSSAFRGYRSRRRRARFHVVPGGRRPRGPYYTEESDASGDAGDAGDAEDADSADGAGESDDSRGDPGA